jgi:hypothetical protein
MCLWCWSRVAVLTLPCQTAWMEAVLVPCELPRTDLMAVAILRRPLSSSPCIRFMHAIPIDQVTIAPLN